MANNYFQFKQFRVVQNHAAMRVNTDGILLGAWCNVTSTKHCLDIGTGTGLIALMLAQRCNAKIDAVEIEEGACNDAKLNFNSSRWSSRLTLYQASIQQYTQRCTHKYETIVCNPPFFNNALKSTSTQKILARHTDSLSFNELFQCVQKLLSPAGNFAIIIPVNEKSNVLHIAEKHNLYANRIIIIKANKNKSAIRLLIEFSFKSTLQENGNLNIYLPNTETYTSGFIKLTKDFYLNF